MGTAAGKGKQSPKAFTFSLIIFFDTFVFQLDSHKHKFII